MNILMALSQLEVTGAEVYAVTIADALIKRGNNVTIVSDTLTKKTNAKYIPIAFNKRKLKDRVSHVKSLLKIIKENDIQIVHANSRASSWSCALACKIAKIPLITTTHGRQPVHMSRKLIKGFGLRSICVCENIQKQITCDLGFDKNKTTLLRNPVDASSFIFTKRDEHDNDIINVSLIGRLSGPKGEVAFNVLDKIKEHKNIHINVIGGKDIPDNFKDFKNYENINFVGFINNVDEYIKKSDVVIGAGRVAIEGILSGRPVIAIGEAIYEGLLCKDNIKKALGSNFGDINTVKATDFHFDRLIDDIKKAQDLKDDDLVYLKDLIAHEFDFNQIIDSIEKLYSKEYVLYTKKEMPIIMYHRVIDDTKDIGVHGTYLTQEKFRSHLQYLKDNGYQTVTFKDLDNNNYKKRFDKGNKFVILTFDDGYVDNYKVAFPILKEFGFKAVIFLLSNSTYNKWDAENPVNPEKKFDLMSDKQIKEMMDYGIEFGAHTMHHPFLATIDINEAKEEIEKSIKDLEARFNYKITTFAYPYGNLNHEVKKLVENTSVKFAVATDSGDICFDSDLMQIRRIGIFPGISLFGFKRKVSGKYNFIKIKREKKEGRNQGPC